jgi:hypothetical protein
MQKAIDVKHDPEAVLLSRVYALILSWVEPEEEHANDANAPTRREGIPQKHEEGKRNGQE